MNYSRARRAQASRLHRKGVALSEAGDKAGALDLEVNRSSGRVERFSSERLGAGNRIESAADLLGRVLVGLFHYPT
jgi:hypothetical protein